MRSRGMEESERREEGTTAAAASSMACRSPSFVFFAHAVSPLLSLSFSSLQVVEASSSDDDSSSDSEGAVATPAAGKKEVRFCFFVEFFSLEQT
jgi:hypothetical protein